MANLASTDITYTPTSVRGRIANRVLGSRQKKVLVSLAFGDGALTYPLNGVPLSTTPSDYGLTRSIERIEIFDEGQATGLQWRLDHTAQKLMGYNPTRKSPMIVEEVITLTSELGAFATPPAYIVALEADTGACPQIQTAGIAAGTVKAAHVSISFVTGAIQGRTSDNYQTIKASYIPQFSQGFFSFGNMVIEEALTGGGTPWTLDNPAACVQFVSEPSSAMTLSPSGLEESVASGEIRLVLDPTTNTIVSCHSDEAAALAITYLKFSGIPTVARTRAYIDVISNGRAITTYETSSEVFRWKEDVAFSREYLVIPGLGNAMVGAITTTNVETMWTGPGDAAANTISRLNFGKNEWESAQTTAIDMFDTPALELTPELMGGAIELFPNIDAPESQTLWAMVYGW